MTEEETGLPQPPTRSERRRAAIQGAAIEEFSARGIARTSMAHIATSAGMSRPALYQYYRDKDEIFAAAFVGLFEQLVEAALMALEGPGTTAERLDAFLQRYEGDLWERMSASSHVDEIIDAKNPHVAEVTAAIVERLSDGLRQYLATVAPGRSQSMKSTRASWVELLRLAPKGFRFDLPEVETLRRRLTALAHAVASAVEAAPASTSHRIR